MVCMSSNIDETVYQTFPIYTQTIEQASNVRKKLKENNIYT